MSRSFMFGLVSVLALLCVLPSLPAFSQASPPSPTAEVQVLLDQAKVALDQYHNKDAIALYQQAREKAISLKDRLGEALALHNIGYVYSATGEQAKALEFYQQALSIRRAVGDKGGEETTLSNIGYVYSATGQPAKALEFYQQALPLQRAIGDKSGEATTLSNIGAVYSNTGQPAKALEFYQQALPLMRAIGDRYGEAITLINIGAVYSNIGQSEKALESLQPALPLLRSVGDKRGEALTLSSIGTVYSNTGQPKKALEFFQQALPIQRSVGNKRGEATTLSNIGAVYSNTGQPAKALEFYQQALLIQRAAGDKYGEATTLSLMGGVYSKTGQSEKALEFYQQALPLQRAVGDKYGEAVTINYIGEIYSNTGQPEKALEFCKQALPIRRAVGDKNGEALTLNNIATVYSNTGQPEKALEFYQQSLLISRAVGNKSSEAGTLSNIGAVYSKTGQLEKALEFFQQALPIQRSVGDKSGEAVTLNFIGEVYTNHGQQEKALEFLQLAMTIRRAVGDKSGEATTLCNIGGVYAKTGHSEKALEFLKQAVTLTETIRTELGGLSNTKTALLDSNQGYYQGYLYFLVRLHRTDEAFAFAQKTKARSLLDLLSAGRVDLTSSVTEQERQELNALRQKANTLNAAMVREGARNQPGSKQQFELAQAQLAQTQSALQTLQDALYARHPDLARKRSAKTATVSDLLPLLPEDTALLEYATEQFLERDKQGKFHNKWRLVVFVVTRQNGKLTVTSHPLAGEYAFLADRAAICRIVCSDPRIPFRVPARDLYRLLIAPAEKEISGKKRLIICAEGPLWDVPFQALIASENKSRTGKVLPTFLSDHFEISYAYSATGALAAYQEKHEPKRLQPTARLLVLANPTLADGKRFGDNPELPGQRPILAPIRPLLAPIRPLLAPIRDINFTERGGLAPLAGTALEARAIQRLFPDARVETGIAAQETLFKQEAGKYRYLHLASHAFFNDASPMFSSVLLADPSQGSPDDGFLTAQELFDMKLSADMVVLSACNTARGGKQTGEGIVGMTWALCAAGVPTQVVSQWSVDDATTAQLMADFYGGLSKGKGAALAAAERKLRHDGKHGHPYYWAPFILVGDAGK